MPIADRRTPTPDVRNIEAGLMLLGAGALLLFVSLFLNWYRPALDAWTAFETWDLLLAVIALFTLFAVAGRMGFGRPAPSSWLATAAAVALVVVVVELVNPPPTAGLSDDPGTGIWLALGGASLMALGALLSAARISVTVNVSGPAVDPLAARSPLADPVGAHTPAADPVAGDPAVAEPATVRTRRRFVRGPEPPPYADEPVAGQAPPTAPTRPV